MCNQLTSITIDVDMILSIRFHVVFQDSWKMIHIGDQTLHVGVLMGNECHWHACLCAFQDSPSLAISRNYHILTPHRVLNF